MGKDKKERFATASETARERPDRYVPDYEEITEAPQRVVMASAALQKRGKTRFAFTMPKPLAYMQLDANYEHVLAWARQTYCKKQKDAIRHLSYFADPRTDIKTANREVFDRFIKDYDYCIRNFRSVFIDTASELLDVRKLAEWGRNTQIPQMYYGGFYADFRWMVKEALKTDCNVNFIHRFKKEYRNDEWNGDYELEGWRGIVYETQVYVEHTREDQNFSTNILECAQNARLMGMSLSSDDEDNDFASLARKIYPASDLDDWQ